MSPQPDRIRLASKICERRKRFAVRGVAPKGHFTGITIGVEGSDVSGDDNMVADPHGIVAVFFGGLGHELQIFGRGKFTTIGQGASELHKKYPP